MHYNLRLDLELYFEGVPHSGRNEPRVGTTEEEKKAKQLMREYLEKKEFTSAAIDKALRGWNGTIPSYVLDLIDLENPQKQNGLKTGVNHISSRSEVTALTRPTWRQVIYWIILLPVSYTAGGLVYWSLYYLIPMLGPTSSDPESIRSQIIQLSAAQFCRAIAIIYFGTWFASPQKRRPVAWLLGILEGLLILIGMALFLMNPDWSDWGELIRGVAGLCGIVFGIKVSRELTTKNTTIRQ
jgi:hypothetical protein